VSRRGSISVPLVGVSGLDVLVLIALVQAFRETGLLQDMGGSGSSHRELCRDVGLGRGGEVGDGVSQRLLVNNSRSESALDGVGLVHNIRLNPDAGEGCREDFDIGLSDNVRMDLLDRISLGQNLRLDHEAGGGDGDGQGLSLGDVENLGLEVGLGLGVDDRGWDVLSVSDGKDLGFDGLIGNGHCRRGRAILMWVTFVDDDRSLVTAPTVLVPPPTLRSALSIGSLLVTITTVHVRVSAIDERRIRHRFVAA